jgi:hypothetical protein
VSTLTSSTDSGLDRVSLPTPFCKPNQAPATPMMMTAAATSLRIRLWYQRQQRQLPERAREFIRGRAEDAPPALHATLCQIRISGCRFPLFRLSADAFGDASAHL